MKPIYDEQLLLAYVENEISTVDRAKVEKWIADDPELADLLKGLRCDREVLLAAPIEEPPAWILDDIKRSMERDMLLDGLPSSHTLNRDETPETAKPSVLARIGVPLSAAAVLVGLIAVAGIIYVNMFGSQTATPGEVAFHHAPNQPGDLSSRNTDTDDLTGIIDGGTTEELTHERSTHLESERHEREHDMVETESTTVADRGHVGDREGELTREIAMDDSRITPGSASNMGEGNITPPVTRLAVAANYATVNVETRNMDQVVQQIQTYSQSNAYVMTQRVSYDRAIAKAMDDKMSIKHDEHPLATRQRSQSPNADIDEPEENKDKKDTDENIGSEDIADRVIIPGELAKRQPAEDHVRVPDIQPRGEITANLMRQEVITMYVPEKDAPDVIKSLSQKARGNQISQSASVSNDQMSDNTMVILNEPFDSRKVAKLELNDEEKLFLERTKDFQRDNAYKQLFELKKKAKDQPAENAQNAYGYNKSNGGKSKSEEADGQGQDKGQAQIPTQVIQKQWTPDAESIENTKDQRRLPIRKENATLQQRIQQRWAKFTEGLDMDKEAERRTQGGFVAIEIVINQIDAPADLPAVDANEMEITDEADE